MNLVLLVAKMTWNSGSLIGVAFERGHLSFSVVPELVERDHVGGVHREQPEGCLDSIYHRVTYMCM